MDYCHRFGFSIAAIHLAPAFISLAPGGVGLAVEAHESSSGLGFIVARLGTRPLRAFYALLAAGVCVGCPGNSGTTGRAPFDGSIRFPKWCISSRSSQIPNPGIFGVSSTCRGVLCDVSVSGQRAATKVRGHLPWVRDIVIRVIIVDPVDLVGPFGFSWRWIIMPLSPAVADSTLSRAAFCWIVPEQICNLMLRSSTSDVPRTWSIAKPSSPS